MNRHLCSSSTEVTIAKDNPSIVVEKRGNITLIGLNKPKIRNAINLEMGRQLTSAIEAFEQDPTASVAVLHGIGGSFCAGYDLSELADPNVTPQAVIDQEGGVMGPTRRTIRKPMICAVSGYCVAGGMEVALICDMRVMEAEAVMGFYNRRFGTPLIDGGSVRLPALIGTSRAMDLILTGRGVRAKEALEMGLVNRVVAVGCGLEEACSLAESIAQFPQACVNHDRNSAYHAMFEAKSLGEAMDYEVRTAGEELRKDALQGAESFKQGVGKSGKFSDVSQKAKSKL